MLDAEFARADALLAAIALPLFAGSLVGALSSVGAVAALGAGGVPASGAVGYALFYDPPE